MITKRQLGIGLMAIGFLALIGTLAIDLIGAGNFNGIGPSQRTALIVGAVVILVGFTLLPFGNHPA
jgi:hypothetical protein